MQRLLTSSPSDGGTNQQTTMDSESMTATTPDLLGLPLELRHDIYEFVVFDLSPPVMAMIHQRTTTFAYRHMSTNILLTSRQIYWEVQNMIVCRGRLIMVSVTHFRAFQGKTPSVSILTGYAGIRVIHPKYRNLCVMDHHINAARSAAVGVPNGGGGNRLREARSRPGKWEFILHQRDIENFCHALMGKYNNFAECVFGPRSAHTFILHCPPSYAQHEYTGVNEMQTQILQQYRSILRGFEDISIRGPSTGWESGLYSATLRDIRSAVIRLDLAGFVDGYMEDLRSLEKEGFDILRQTGDLEAADASWHKAMGICREAKISFRGSFEPPRPQLERTRYASDIQKWTRLRQVHGNACAVPIIDFKYRLLVIRVSEVLRLIERGGHLDTKYGRGPRDPSSWGCFAYEAWSESLKVKSQFGVTNWLPQPSEEIQMCCTVAAVFRLLDEKTRSLTAKKAMERAWLISSHVGAIQREAFRQEMFRFSSWLLNYSSPRAMA